MANNTNSEKTGYVYDDIMLLHKGPSDHPECPARIRVIHNALQPILEKCVQVPSRQAFQEEVESVHTKKYVNRVVKIPKKIAERKIATFKFPNDENTFACRDSVAAALHAVGGSLDLSYKVAQGELKNGFAIIRPPGHHACRAQAMGFCLFNNVGIIAQTAISKWNLHSVLIVDFDVHHGNGTQDMFADNNSVLYISLHRWQQGTFYPGTGDPAFVGTEAGKGFSVNVGWNQKHMTDQDYLFAFQHVVIPIAKEFNPELILVSAGFDAAKDDPHGEMNLTPAAYGSMTEMLMQVCSKTVVVLEGGYNLESNASSALAVMKELVQDTYLDLSELNLEENDKIPSLDCVDDVIVTLTVQSEFWESAKQHLKLVQSFKNQNFSKQELEKKKVANLIIHNDNDGPTSVTHLTRASRRTAEAIWKDEIFKLERRLKELQDKLKNIGKLQKQIQRKAKLSKTDLGEIGQEEAYLFEKEEIEKELKELKSLSKEEAIILYTNS